MSTTSTSTASATSATSSCYAKLYDIPVHDAACAMPMRSNYSAIMSDCCGSAQVVEYDSCDYYCLAEDQTVGELGECMDKAVGGGNFWCNTNANATATGTATATATGVVTLSATTTGADSTGTATSSGATSTSTSTSNAAPRSFSKSAIGVVGMLLAGTAAGAFL